jgi:hypothetical protein
MVSCVETLTYNHTEVVTNVVRGYSKRESVMNPAFWEEIFQATWRGRCYTMRYPVPLSKLLDQDMLILLFSGNHGVYIDLHDPDYYVLNINPMAAKKTQIRLSTNTTFATFSMFATIQHIELNGPRDPCEDEPSYSFTGCVQESFSRQVGCRTKWDHYSGRDRPICSTMNQFRFL